MPIPPDSIHHLIIDSINNINLIIPNQNISNPDTIKVLQNITHGAEKGFYEKYDKLIYLVIGLIIPVTINTVNRYREAKKMRIFCMNWIRHFNQKISDRLVILNSFIELLEANNDVYIFNINNLDVSMVSDLDKKELADVFSFKISGNFDENNQHLMRLMNNLSFLKKNDENLATKYKNIIEKSDDFLDRYRDEKDNLVKLFQIIKTNINSNHFAHETSLINDLVNLHETHFAKFAMKPKEEAIKKDLPPRSVFASDYLKVMEDGCNNILSKYVSSSKIAIATFEVRKIVVELLFITHNLNVIRLSYIHHFKNLMEQLKKTGEHLNKIFPYYKDKKVRFRYFIISKMTSKEKQTEIPPSDSSNQSESK
jgi:hypothetical protein